METLLKIYCDGGARGNPGPAAAAFVVERRGKVIFKSARFLGKATNNVAEYSAVLLAMRWLSKFDPKDLSEVRFILDSELVAKQLAGLFKIKNENLRILYFSVKEEEKKIPLSISFAAVPRNKNRLADLLVNRTLDENL
ncbi:MAG: Ribonuclease H [Candidatus Woesebacteria bacterium GW2011_GWE1_45_18]|uniref:Ribonuclease H n=1 Tax=Candidatus Woesebacteria bacterium GW2011_GWE1_45_18 TaxID=1618598 RepID=A0A0G1M4A3_9BACT|nr:MAG: Ribonuclease H [Candidatus Woesebacteria bacterium GW2011_GWE1_45_18]